MILDVESSPKSPRSSASSPGSSTQASFFRYPQSHVSYSTFTSTESQRHVYDPNAPISDITSLLGGDRGLPAINDEPPPAYDEVDAGQAMKPHGNRFWTRFAGVVLTVFLIYSTWVSYDMYKHQKPIIRIPHHSPSSPSDPSISSPAPSPTSSVPHSSLPPEPTNPSPPPPKDRPSLPDGPYVPPISGRADLCRPWAYALDDYSDSRLTSLGSSPIDRLIYTVPSFAPIHIETAAICPSSKGGSERCNYEGANDAIMGKLQVVGGDVDKPRIDVSFQHGSEIGLEDVSVCLVRRPKAAEKKISEDDDHQWVLGVYIWKYSDLPGHSNVHASLSISVILPTSRTHNFSTELSHFTQTIGPSDSSEASISFGALYLTGNPGPTLIQNITAAVVQGTSSDSELALLNCRISQSLDLRSVLGHVGCNATLLHESETSPVTVNLQSEAGIVAGIFDLDYFPNLNSPPRFNLEGYSKLSRSMFWVTDHRGTKSLQSNTLPPVLPALNVNLTSWYASAQLLVPATFHGSLELSSRYGSIVTNDHAKNLAGRTIRWFRRLEGVSQALVKWAGRDQRQSGSVHLTSQFAAVRILFLGLHDDDIKDWPTEGDQTNPRSWSIW